MPEAPTPPTDHLDAMGSPAIRSYHLNDLDSSFDRPFYVVCMDDPYTSQVTRTVFAWGHPVLLIRTESPDENGLQETTWWWSNFDLGPEMSQTRHREVVVHFLMETGMLTAGSPESETTLDGLYEAYADHCGSPEEEHYFNALTEYIGEHEPDQFVDRVIESTPFPE